MAPPPAEVGDQEGQRNGDVLANVLPEGNEGQHRDAFMVMMERVASALEDRPAHHTTRSVKVDAFDPDKHKASTWFNQFASACQAQEVPDKHLWCCLTQNIRLGSPCMGSAAETGGEG